MKMKEESKKAGWKLNIQKPKIMTSSPIASWQIDGKTMETVTDFIFLGFKITADYDCKHEIKGCSWKESSDKPRQHIEKQGVILPTKVRLVKATAFPVVMYGCESRTIKKGWVLKCTIKKGWVLLNSGAWEDSWEFLGLQNQTSPS